MGTVLQFPFTDAVVPAFTNWRRSNVGMEDAPRDGRIIWIMVAGPADGQTRRPEHTRHWLPWPVRWYAGRWSYARYNSPLFPWHDPLSWQEEKPETVPWPEWLARGPQNEAP